MRKIYGADALALPDILPEFQAAVADLLLLND
jgi:hypothetical protein